MVSMPTESNEKWQLLSRLLDQALDLEEPERARWLESLAENDPEMAAKLSAALAARERDGFTGFLAGSAVDLQEIGNSTLVGRQVGPYVIDAQIGRGGMGSVWKAHRTDGLYSGVVAIKFVHAAWIGSAGEQRFRIEGNLLGRLDHPNIARLIDAGVLVGTQPYLILEYIEGEPIDAYCDREKLGLEARIGLFLGVLAAVAHAHSHLIVHRDIKPSNIFVAGGGTVKLLDFGIAKLLQGDGEAAPTQSSAIPLTPQYAAPEQLLGKPVTTVTDVYSLGLVLYELLTGAHPLNARTRSSAELLHAVLTEEPARASAASSVATISRRALEGDLDNILGKALKKDPSERYASVGAFADDLKRFLSHEPVQARPDTIPYRVSKFVQRHRGGVLSALAVTLALIGTTAFALWELREARADRDMAISEGRRAHGHDVMMGFLFNDSVRQSPEDAVHKRLDRAREFIDRQYRGDPDIAAALLLSLHQRYIDIGDAKSALEVRNSAEAIARRYNDPYVNADIACATAQDLAIAADWPAARAQLESAMANMGRLRVVSSDLRVTCAEPAARVAQAEGDFATAISQYRILVAGMEKDGDNGSDSWVAATYGLASALGLSTDYRAALEVDRHILEVMRAQGLKDTSTYFAIGTLGCAVLRAGGQPTASVAFVASTIAEARSGGADIDVPYFLEGCRDLSRIASGEVSTDLEASLMRNAKSVAASGMQHIVIPYQAALTHLEVNRGDLAAAEAKWVPLAAIEDEMLKSKRSGIEVTAVLLLHAKLEILRGNYAAASRLIDDLAAKITAHHQTNPDDKLVSISRAELALATRDFDAAVRQAETALEFSRRTAIDPQSSIYIGEALLWRARAEAGLGQKAKASATAHEALPHLEKNMDPTSAQLAAARELAST
jgi:eukaryotic-like serine/threonine-protein kinase